jgi:hypothetical protein
MVFNRPVTTKYPLALLATTILCGMVACGKSQDQTEKPAPSSDRSVQSSLVGSEWVADLSALHDTVEARAARADTLGLLQLMVNDSVYREVVWPTTPSYEPEREEVWNLVMSMHKSNSNKGLRRLLHDIGHPESGDVLRLALAPTDFGGGQIHELAKTSRTGSGVVLFGSALCVDTRGCQVISYGQGGQRGAAAVEE